VFARLPIYSQRAAIAGSAFLFWQGISGKSTQKSAHFEGKKEIEVAFFSQ
jgi:hypothetical protein